MLGTCFGCGSLKPMQCHTVLNHLHPARPSSQISNQCNAIARSLLGWCDLIYSSPRRTCTHSLPEEHLLPNKIYRALCLFSFHLQVKETVTVTSQANPQSTSFQTTFAPYKESSQALLAGDLSRYWSVNDPTLVGCCGSAEESPPHWKHISFPPQTRAGICSCPKHEPMLEG